MTDSVALTLYRWWDDRHWAIGVVLTVVFLPVSAVLFALFGAMEGAGKWWTFAGGCLAIAVGSGLLVLEGWGKRQLQEAADADAQAVLVLMKDALHPVIETIGSMPKRSKHDRGMQLVQVAQEITHSLALIMPTIDRLRAVVYTFDASGDCMEVMAYHGRGDTPAPFESGTGRGDKAMQMVRAGDRVAIADVQAADPGFYGGSKSGYRSFVSASIFIREPRSITPFGMLTVDAPDPDSFGPGEERVVQLLADLLAVAFAIADRGTRVRRVGSV